jgi:hypothetical protein
MESGGSFAERPGIFRFLLAGGSLGRGDPACRMQSALALKLRARNVLSSLAQPASSVCKKLINTRGGSRTVAGPGASVLRSGQAMPHFVILRHYLTQ